MGSRWFDEQSRIELERRGWPKLSPAQTALFAYLSDTPTPPAELARRLGNTRQATHDLVQGLVRLDLLEVHDDPDRRGGRLVCVTARGLRLAQDAYAILRELENAIGDDIAEPLRRLLMRLPGTP